MIDTILHKIKMAFEEVCPYEVRLSHSKFPKKIDRPFILINVESINTDKVQAEDNRIRYPLTTVISIKAVVPFKYSILELRRIAVAYIMPVMTDMSLGITSFSESSETDHISEGVHKLEIKFKIKGVYTAYQKEDI